MNLETLKDTIETICLAHKDVKQFNFGETFDVVNGGANIYPFCFLELPYLIDYPVNSSIKKDIQFALNILLYTPPDDIKANHQALSDAETIGDAILARLQNDIPDLYFNNISALSLLNFSDDDTSGIRFEFNVTTSREYCNNYNVLFNDC